MRYILYNDKTILFTDYIYTDSIGKIINNFLFSIDF